LARKCHFDKIFLFWQVKMNMMEKGRLARKNLREIFNERKTTPKYIHVALDPSTRRVLSKALNVYNDVNSITGLLRRIIIDWDHYRRMLILFKDRIDKMVREIDEIKQDIGMIKQKLILIESKL